MQGFTNILTSALTAIVNFIKNFTVDLYHALYFKAIEYDDYLKATKTTKVRIITWVCIFGGVLLFLIILLNIFYYFMNNLSFVDQL